MMGPMAVNGDGETVGAASPVEAGDPSRSGASAPPTMAAATGSEDHVSDMMGRRRLTPAEAEAVVLDDGIDEIAVHSKWALIGKVLPLDPSYQHNLFGSAARVG